MQNDYAKNLFFIFAAASFSLSRVEFGQCCPLYSVACPLHPFLFPLDIIDCEGIASAQIEITGFEDLTIVLLGPSRMKSAPCAFAIAALSMTY